MTTGGSIGVIATGATLTFAVTVNPPGLNLDVLGVILMFSGTVLLALRLKTQPPTRIRRGRALTESVIVEEPIVLDEPPVLGDDTDRLA
ncbi:MAG TPA: hypothetical protein VG452_10065 [Egibacteraceae bacterium]|nr:hypothetical protein [Egibacteraceae bacterium]